MVRLFFADPFFFIIHGVQQRPGMFSFADSSLVQGFHAPISIALVRSRHRTDARVSYQSVGSTFTDSTSRRARTRRVQYHILVLYSTTKVFLYENQTDNSYDTVDYLLTRTLSYTRRFVGAPTHGEAAAALASKLSRANLVQSERRTEGFTQTGRRRLCWTSSGCRDAPRGGAK